MTQQESVKEQAGFSIGVVARITGINANTLRMWERRYQLGPSRRSAGGHREYTATDVDHLKLIQKLIQQGMKIGDIAQLPMKTLSSLLIETGGPLHEDAYEQNQPARALVIGESLCSFFKSHLKRYPTLLLELSEKNPEDWLENSDVDENRIVIIQLPSLNRKHLKSLVAVSNTKVHIIVSFVFSNSEVINALHSEGVLTVQNQNDPAQLDDAIAKVLRIENHMSLLEQNGKTFDLHLPSTHPRQFQENHLIEAEKQANKLNCECPPHLTDLIRRLTAFEEYSKTCGAENWKQAAIHACVYTYANQARFYIEKALTAVLDE